MSKEKIKSYINNLYKKQLQKPFTIDDNRYKFNNKIINWIDVVEYGMNKDLKLLIEFGKFRKQVVDYILNTIKHELKCNNCSFRSVGSVTLTSDYDVSAFGKKKEEVVTRFNELFVDIFGEESGIVFDTNIYGVTSLIPMPLDKNLKRNTTYASLHVCNEEGECKKYKYVSIPKGITVDIANQRSWAFIKLFRYLDQEDVKNLQKKIKKLKINLLNADTYNSIERFKQLKKIGDFDNISKMNKMYNKMLTRVKLTREKMEMYPNSLFHKITYKDAESHANFFSSESYYTQGAFFHVVARNQMNIKTLQITENELLDSFIENIGDFMKDIKHMSRVNCLEVVIKLSKYWMRFLDAIILIQEVKPDYKIKFYNSDVLIKAKETATYIRKNIRGKKLVEDCKEEFDSCIEIKTAEIKIKELLDILSIPECNVELIKDKTLDFLVSVLKTHYKVINGRMDGGEYFDKYVKYKTKYLELKKL